MTAELTCEMCGVTDPHVVKGREYVGGKRYTTLMNLCANRLACWLRRDIRNGNIDSFTSTEDAIEFLKKDRGD